MPSTFCYVQALGDCAHLPKRHHVQKARLGVLNGPMGPSVAHHVHPTPVHYSLRCALPVLHHAASAHLTPTAPGPLVH